MFDKLGGIYNNVAGMFSGIVSGASSFVKRMGITSITTPTMQVGIAPQTIPQTMTSATAPQTGVTVEMKPQLPTKMILIGGGLVVGVLMLMMFMRK